MQLCIAGRHSYIISSYTVTQVAICINKTQEYMEKRIQFEQEEHERRQRNFVKVGGEEERRRREHLAQKLDYLPEDY